MRQKSIYVRTFLLILSTFIWTSCGQDLCRDQKNEIASLKRDIDMWQDNSNQWQQNYYDKECPCTESNQQYYYPNEPETVSL